MSFFQLEPLYLYTTHKQVQVINDIKGLKIRSSGTLTNQALAALGAVPVAIASSEIYIAMQKGIIDGALASPSMMEAYRLYEITKYALKFPLGYTVRVININLNTWHSLPADIQTIISTAARKAGYYNVTMFNTYDASITAKLNDQGPSYTLPAEEAANWINAIRPVINDWVTSMETAGKPVQELLTAVREQCQQKGVPFPY